MKNKIAVFMIAGALIAPSASLWAAAGDAAQQGPNGTVTGTPAAATPKKHHGKHHKKPAAATTSATGTTSGTATK